MTAKIPKPRSVGEETLALHIRAAGLPQPTREYRFHEKRRWRFDFAWPARKLAVEVDGVTGGPGGRHQRRKGFAEDCVKHNTAILDGWRPLRFTTEQVKDGTALAMIERALSQSELPL